MKFKDLLSEKDGMIKGPFGSAVKKSLFVQKSKETYKVYEQSVVANKDFNIGNYYLPKKYVDDKLERFFIKPGDILMTGAGTLGLLALVPDNAEIGIMNQALIRIRLNEKIVYKPFFMYYFPWAIKDIACRINGDSVIPNLPPINILKDIDISLPSFKKQVQIANILDKINSKIENNNKIISELESMAKTIYDYWFLQFEFPNEEGKPYKSSGGKMVWNEKLKREIPEGWTTTSVGSILGNYPKTSSVTRENYQINGKYPIIDQSQDFICGYTNDETKILSLNDVIVYGDHTNTIKYVNFDFARGADGTQIINSKSKTNPNCLLYQQLKNLPIIEKGYSRHFKFLKEQIVLMPLSEVSLKYYEITFKFYKEISILRKENQELSSLRDFLLPMLMNGQIEIKQGRL